MFIVYVVGNLTKDVELKYSEKGVLFARVSIAVDAGYGEKKTTQFINLVNFSNAAQRLFDWSKKGTQVVICGKVTKVGVWKDSPQMDVEVLDFQVTQRGKPKEEKQETPFDVE